MQMASGSGSTSHPSARWVARVTLAEMKAEPVFTTSPLVRQSRLSVVPLTDEQLATIVRLGTAR